MTLEATWQHREKVHNAAWAEHIACRGMSDVMFGVLADTRTGGTNWSQARAVCASCPVRQECLDHAIRNDEPHHMWGGLTPDERRGTVRTRNCDGCGTRFTSPNRAGAPNRYCRPECKTEARRLRA